MFCLATGQGNSNSQEKHTLSGYVRDGDNGETLIGATVRISELNTGGITNVYGFYSITVPPGDYTLIYTYVGYESITKKVSLAQNLQINVELPTVSQTLREVVVLGKAEDQNVESTEMSVAELDIKTIEKIPAFLGEVDVVKSLQLLPGVSTVGEATSGFNVRGGGVGQNLVLLDEAPVYNSSHLFGFFSIFNPDAVKDVKLYKGGIPSEYGGRLSSILDVRMKEGNSKRFQVNGGIGVPIFSRIAVQGPIIPEKASFIVAARRSYVDILTKPFWPEDIEDAGLRFYDVTMKTNYNINKKNRIYLSSYIGRDVFKADANQGFDWGNKTATFRWNHIFSERIFSNTSVFISDYDYSFQVGETEEDLFSWKSRILTYNLKEQINYFINPKNELSLGIEGIMYRFKPAEVLGVSVGESQDFSLDERKSVESAAYLSNKHTVTNKLSLEYGVRVSAFHYFGSGSVFEFDPEDGSGLPRAPISQRQADNWELIEDYYNIEPRFSFRYKFTPSLSVKGSYNRMSQYIHLVSNTTASLPTDVWTPSTNNIEPQIADQVALGLFKNYENNMYETSIEIYYKESQNQLDYVDGAQIFINPNLEGDVLSGNGRAYGAELYLKKGKGQLTGWISYTLARTELQVSGVNKGNWYPTRFDQRHNAKLTMNYTLNRKWDFSTNFTYLTGTPLTLPIGRATVNAYTYPLVGSRNAARIPDYHRLDISATWDIGTHWDVVFTIYNLYGRRNPFSVYFSQNPDSFNGVAETQATQVAILGSVIPAVSFNFDF